ncbi:MAG: S8 family serine peptidase [Clostridia bacterium]|nr:S8 family serine peptidase [Clostridia bacterium]
MTEKIGMTEAEWKLSVSEDTSIEEIHAFKKIKADISSKIYTKNNTALAKKHLASDEIIYISKYSPSVLATMSADKIKSLATKSNDILNIDLYSDEEIECSLYSGNTSEEIAARIAELQRHYNYNGDGINIGIYDTEIPNSDDIPSCNYMGYYGPNDSGIGTLSHAENMATIIIDIAPGANYYFTASGDKTVYERIEWLIDNYVDVINSSMSIGQKTSMYTALSKWFDHISYQHYITIVMSVGNKDIDENLQYTIVGPVAEAQMSYNCIAVGGINHNTTPTNYSDDFQAATIYSTVSSFNVPFKPDICAPYGDSSQSAALTTGVVALLMGERSSLLPYPEIIKAILTACVNTDSPYRFLPKDRSTNEQINSYMQFGAGLIDAYLAITCATSGNYAQALMLSSDTMKTHTFTVTNTDPVRISLSFLQPVDIVTNNHISTSNFSDYNKLDLDLTIRNESLTTQYCNSSISANNVEIVTFNPPAPGTYKIQVSRYGTQSEASNAWYGVAWYQE